MRWRRREGGSGGGGEMKEGEEVVDGGEVEEREEGREENERRRGGMGGLEEVEEVNVSFLSNILLFVQLNYLIVQLILKNIYYMFYKHHTYKLHFPWLRSLK